MKNGQVRIKRLWWRRRAPFSLHTNKNEATNKHQQSRWTSWKLIKCNLPKFFAPNIWNKCSVLNLWLTKMDFCPCDEQFSRNSQNCGFRLMTFIWDCFKSIIWQQHFVIENYWIRMKFMFIFFFFKSNGRCYKLKTSFCDEFFFPQMHQHCIALHSSQWTHKIQAHRFIEKCIGCECSYKGLFFWLETQICTTTLSRIQMV